MWLALIWLMVGALGIVLEAALASSIPAYWLPDLSLLATMAAALVLRPMQGLLVACLLGLGADMVSDALVGQHAFMRLFEWLVVYALAGQIEFRRWRRQAVAGFALLLFDALGLFALSWFFLGSFSFVWTELGGWLLRALATGVFAPLVIGLAQLIGRLLSEQKARRELQLRTRRPVL